RRIGEYFWLSKSRGKAEFRNVAFLLVGTISKILNGRSSPKLHRKEREAGRDQTRAGSDVCRSARKPYHADGCGPLLLLCPVFFPISHFLVGCSGLFARAGLIQSSAERDGKIPAPR